MLKLIVAGGAAAIGLVVALVVRRRRRQERERLAALAAAAGARRRLWPWQRRRAVIAQRLALTRRSAAQQIIHRLGFTRERPRTCPRSVELRVTGHWSLALGRFGRPSGPQGQVLLSDSRTSLAAVSSAGGSGFLFGTIPGDPSITAPFPLISTSALGPGDRQPGTVPSLGRNLV